MQENHLKKAPSLTIWLSIMLLLLSFTGLSLADSSHPGQNYRKKQPRTELSAKSKKGIDRILREEYLAKPGTAPDKSTRQTEKNRGEYTQAKAESERIRIEQKQIIEENLHTDDMPSYLRRAFEANRDKDERNLKRFAEAVSEFQMQELRQKAIEHIDDPEKFNRYMSIIASRQYSPFTPIQDSGYVINKSTGEISVGNTHTAGMHDKKVQADTSRKNASVANYHARTKESRERTLLHAEKKAALSPASGKTQAKPAAAAGMTLADYQKARQRAIEANRTDIVRELDDMARYMGLIN